MDTDIKDKKNNAAGTIPDLRNFWMPFSSNSDFKEKPRLFEKAKGMYFETVEGRTVLDGTAGLWCCNCGHSHERIVEAIREQAGKLDFAPTFQMGHPLVFELASKLAKEIFPGDLNTIFFGNSGSEAVDSALKIALAYQRHIGQGQRTLLIGRDRAYHGVNFGGISVGGIGLNRKWFGNKLKTAHIRHTHDLSRNAFSAGQPKHGGKEFADDLERLLLIHDPSTVAAVIIEPIAGSTGVLIPPEGYLERIREICDKHGILLILDEIITGFGRVGESVAAKRFGIKADMITFAKGVNSGTVPLGGVAVKDSIYETFIDKATGKMIDFFHGYTYTGHPLAVAAGIATLDVYREENLFARSRELEDFFAEQIHSLDDAPNVIDVRNFGLVGAIELAPREGNPTARAYDAFCDAFWNENLLIRTTGDTIAISPPLIVGEDQIGEIFTRLRKVLDRTN